MQWRRPGPDAERMSRDMRLLRLRRRGLTLQQISDAFRLSRGYIAERVRAAERVALLRAARHGADLGSFKFITQRKGPAARLA